MTTFEIIVIVLLGIIATGIMWFCLYAVQFCTQFLAQRIEKCESKLGYIEKQLDDIEKQLDDIEHNVHDDLYIIISKLNKPKRVITR